MKDTGFLEFSIKQIVDGYQQGLFAPMDVAQACIRQVERLEPDAQAWVCFEPEKLIRGAEEITARLKAGHKIRPLEGIPIGVKDIINTADFPTQMGSPLWGGFTPGNDARIVHYLREAGALISGKTVTAEFAVHTLGKTLNPHDITRNPGTSSSGSAVACALGMVPAALGTQTAGSIVRPASFCGIYGYKPSFGLVPRTGMLKTTDSLDTVGFFVTHLEDIPVLFDTIRVHGQNYPISHAALSDTERQTKPANRPWRVALAKTHTWEHALPYAQDALLSWAQQLNECPDIEVHEVSLPAVTTEAHEIHATIYDKTLSYYFKDEYSRAELVSPIMNELIRSGQNVTPQQYQQALKAQEAVASSVDSFFQDYDVVISLSTASEAPLRDEVERPDPALLWNLCYVPTCSAPVFTAPSGLPFGVQILARRYNDYLLQRFLVRLNQANLIPNGPNPLAPSARLNSCVASR